MPYPMVKVLYSGSLSFGFRNTGGVEVQSSTTLYIDVVGNEPVSEVASASVQHAHNFSAESKMKW